MLSFSVVSLGMSSAIDEDEVERDFTVMPEAEEIGVATSDVEWSIRRA